MCHTAGLDGFLMRGDDADECNTSTLLTTRKPGLGVGEETFTEPAGQVDVF